MDLIPKKEEYMKNEPEDLLFDQSNSSFVEIKEQFCDTTQVKQQEPPRFKFEEVQIKSESLDIKTPIKDEDLDIKCEQFLTEELDVKDESVVEPLNISKTLFDLDIYKCDICDYKASGKAKLHWHKCIHSDETIYCCNECEYKTTKENNFHRHTIIHTGNNFKCKICGYMAARKYSFKRHMLIHSREKPFKCTLCDYKSSQKHHIQRHMSIHTEKGTFTHSSNKTFKCTLCNYESIRKHHMQRHMLVHSGEKPFKCTQCDYKSAYRHAILKHKKTHLIDEYFRCNKCDFRTRVKLNFLMHIHTKERLFNCNICDYKATQKHYLQQHMITHTNEKPFKCTVCNYQTAYKRNIIVHKKKHLTGKFFQCSKCNYKTAVKLNFQLHIHNVESVRSFGPIRNLDVRKCNLKEEKKSTGTEKLIHKCSKCSYKTKVKRLFDMHLPTHVKQEKVEARPSISIKPQLTQNIQQNSGDTYFKCNVCNYRTTVERNFQMHIHSPEQTNSAGITADPGVPSAFFQSTNMNMYNGIANTQSATVTTPGVSLNSGFFYVVNPLQTLNQNYYYQL